MSQTEEEPNYFFLSDQKVFVKRQGNIWGSSRQGEMYNGQKWALKYLKIALQNESNMPYYVLCDCQSNTMNIFAKFHENILNLSQEIEKNIENVPPPPLKKLNSKKPQTKSNTPHKVF